MSKITREAVLSALGKSAIDIEVRQDGAYLTAENKGEDVLLGLDGRSTVAVHEGRSYNVVRNREHGEHILKLTAGTDGVSLYSLAFAAGAVPELISG